MMKTKNLIYLILILGTHLQAQKSYFTYKPIKIDEIAAKENEFKSNEVFKNKIVVYEKTIKDYEQPKIYERPKTKDYDAAEIEYFYNKKDSITKSISYRWKVKYINNRYKFFKKYNEQFTKVVDLISKEIGFPTSNDNQIIKMKSNPFGEFYQKSNGWNTDKFSIQVTQIWSKDDEFVEFTTYIRFN